MSEGRRTLRGMDLVRANPLVVRLTVWGVPTRRVPSALARMGLDRRRLHGRPGLRFAKLLGTGDGRTFTLRDADPRHWALLTVWDDTPDGAADADRFAATTHHRWDAISDERLDVTMSPIASRGRWAGREPFGSTFVPGGREPVQGAGGREPAGQPGHGTRRPGGAVGRPSAGAVASITRARLRPPRAVSFWRAVPPVSADLTTVTGLALAIGIGEAPIGLQGTFSLWQSNAALNDFAHRRPAHQDVVRRTEPERWYAEELFARFAVRSITGTFGGRTPLADSEPGPGDAPISAVRSDG